MDIVTWLLSKRYSDNVVAKTNDEINDMVNVLGAKNMLPITESSDTVMGVSFTINDNGSVDIEGTTGAEGSGILLGYNILPKGTYKLTTGQAIEQDAHICVYAFDATTYEILGISRDDSGGALGEFTIDEGANIGFVISADENLTYNLTIYPMCRLASIESDSFVPYTKTNKELTAIANKLQTFTPTGITLVDNGDDISAYVGIKQYGNVVTVDCTVTPYVADTFTIARGLPYCANVTVIGNGRHTNGNTEVSPNEFWITGDELMIRTHSDGLSYGIYTITYITY